MDSLAYNGKNPDLGKTYEAFVKKGKGTGDLKTSYRGTSRFYPDAPKTAKRVVFVGMGKRADVTADRLRRAAAIAQKQAAAADVKAFRLLVHADDHKDLDAEVAALANAWHGGLDW